MDWRVPCSILCALSACPYCTTSMCEVTQVVNQKIQSLKCWCAYCYSEKGEALTFLFLAFHHSEPSHPQLLPGYGLSAEVNHHYLRSS